MLFCFSFFHLTYLAMEMLDQTLSHMEKHKKCMFNDNNLQDFKYFQRWKRFSCLDLRSWQTKVVHWPLMHSHSRQQCAQSLHIPFHPNGSGTVSACRDCQEGLPGSLQEKKEIIHIYPSELVENFPQNSLVAKIYIAWQIDRHQEYIHAKLHAK